ncbi:MAG: Gfo/Idh/MocA family oxidoreductase [Lachnospiraceae bacterium]|nr:Gfo/Idh/MocA family oxidoreductase [Lachnospiraceae bacterium]
MLKIGVMGPANIAKTRMIPTIFSTEGIEYAGVAVAGETEWDRPEKDDAYAQSAGARTRELADEFVTTFGGRVYESYGELLTQDDIDIIYMPLPPSLHYKWGRMALENGKHVLMEKPFTLSKQDTQELLGIAEEKNLAVIENYGFPLHEQFLKIRELLAQGKIGELRLIRTAFGFPHRAANDFRYSRYFGGGALFDCGGYTLKLASQFLSGQIEVLAPSLTTTPGHEVDIYGSGTLTDGKMNVQLSFGMDQAYKCELELWGSEATLLAPRFYTAPGDFKPELSIKSNAGEEKIPVPACNQFQEILKKMMQAVGDPDTAAAIREEILLQADLVDRFAKGAGLG